MKNGLRIRKKVVKVGKKFYVKLYANSIEVDSYGPYSTREIADCFAKTI